jgi:hypothetical protein
MALTVTITRTTPLYPHGAYVQWDLDGAVEEGSYFFSLLRSGSSNGPWDEIMPASAGAYNFMDRFPTPSVAGYQDPTQLSLVRGFFYKVLCVPPSGFANQVSAVTEVEPTLEGKQRLIKRKILRDESLMLQRLNGVPVAVLKRRHWGTRCPKCYDKYTKESMRSNCTNCWGTTFVGGYFDPVITFAKRGVTPNQVGMTAQGKAEIATTNVTMLDVPGLQDDDILVFLRDNKRFLVKRVLPTEIQTVTVHQRLEVSELPRSDIIYRVQVDPFRLPRLF